jgi:hypothetical protein
MSAISNIYREYKKNVLMSKKDRQVWEELLKQFDITA